MANLNELTKANIASYSKSLKNMPDWKILTDSDQESLSNYGYYSIALVNENNKEIIIANSGSNFVPYTNSFTDFISYPINLFWDLINNYQIYSHNIPYQYSYGAKAFTSKILNTTDNIDDYKVYLTGHSLGAVISELTAIDYANKPNLYTIVFESLGSYEIIEKNFPNQNHNKANISIYNIPHNIINSTNKHLVEPIEIQVTSSKSYFSAIINLLPEDNIISTFQNHWFNNVYNSLKNNSSDNQFYEIIDFCPIDHYGITSITDSSEFFE